MKWRKVKQTPSPSSSSSRSSWISNVLPAPWLKKFKRMSVNSVNKYATPNLEEQWNSPHKFHGEGDEPFWRLSFREKILDDACDPKLDSFESSKLHYKPESFKFGDMGEKVRESKRLPGNSRCKMEKQRRNRTCDKVGEEMNAQREDYNLICLDVTDFSDEDNYASEGERRKTMYVCRKSVEKKRRKQRAMRVKSISPRQVAKVRGKKKEKRKDELCLKMDGLAVVKISTNPLRDFRDSMVEMIKEGDLSHREELEELLSCYLQLNCDEYHEVIIKVFRQLWFELNQTCPFCDLENKHL